MADLTLEQVTQRMTAVANALKERLGARFVTAALYGSAARGEYVPGRSDLNVLLVLERADLETLEQCAPLLQTSRAELRLSVLVLTREELRNAADVFPIKLLDIRRRYQVLSGEDVLKDLTVAFRDVRLSCEYEIRNVALKLRRSYLMMRPDVRALLAPMRKLLPPLLGVLRALVEQGGEAAGGGDVVAAAAARFGFDAEALRAALATRTRTDLTWPELERTYGGLIAVLEKLAVAVDQLPTS
jgi:predicted nucleotidyltransferase